MRAPLLFALLLWCAAGIAQDAGRPVGKNCALAGPPDSAGEVMNHGMTLKVFPRAYDIDGTYTGCQMMWMPHEGKWHILSVVEIKSGDPSRIWSPDKSDPVRWSCLYRKGKVVKGDAKRCAAPEVLITKSLAPGCVERITQAVAKDGLEAPWPSGCRHE